MKVGNLSLVTRFEISRLYRPVYLTEENFTSTGLETTRIFRRLQRLLCPESEKIIQTMVDYRRERREREMLALACTQRHRILREKRIAKGRTTRLTSH